MTESFTSTRADLLAALDGFRVVIDEARARADLILDRPPLNVITMVQRAQMAAVIEELDRRQAIRVIVLRGAGENFSSGGDIPGFMDQTPETLSKLAWNVAALERCAKPVIAAIRVYCFGVGFELCLACDFRILGQSAQLGLPEMRIGMIPGSGGSARLVKMIGIGRAKDMAMRSRRVPAAQAVEWGLALEAVGDDELDAAVDALVGELLNFSPLAQRTLKSVLNGATDSPLHVAIETEGQAFGRLRGSDDFREGVASFKDKRRPKFEGA